MVKCSHKFPSQSHTHVKRYRGQQNVNQLWAINSMIFPVERCIWTSTISNYSICAESSKNYHHGAEIYTLVANRLDLNNKQSIERITRSEHKKRAEKFWIVRKVKLAFFLKYTHTNTHIASVESNAPYIHKMAWSVTD